MNKVSDYNIADKLGQGAYGVVYKVRWKKDNRVSF
jgi:serine/threonine protein kinase